MEHHGIFVADKGSQQLYQQAINTVVSTNSTVLDLGCGTGIHTLFACRAGASRVYAVESTDVIHLARKVVEANGFSDRVTFLHGLSTEVEIPEPVDTIVTNQGVNELLRYLTDAATRFLKPGGNIIPSSVAFSFAPLELPPTYKKTVEFWSRKHYGLDFSPMREYSINSPKGVIYQEKNLLGPAQATPAISLQQMPEQQYRWDLQLPVAKAGTLHGLGDFYTFQLAPGVPLNTAPPMSVGAPPWLNSLFPIDKPISVMPGDRVKALITFLPNVDPYIMRWQIAVQRKTRTKWETLAECSQSNFCSLPITADFLKKSRPDARPILNNEGEMTRFTLDLIAKKSEKITIGDLEKEVYKKFKNNFRNRDAAATHIARVLERYS